MEVRCPAHGSGGSAAGGQGVLAAGRVAPWRRGQRSHHQPRCLRRHGQVLPCGCAGGVLAWLQMLWWWARAALREHQGPAMWAAGITTLDTADNYGPSEALIGQWRRLYPHNRSVVLTKLSFMGPTNVSRDMVEYRWGDEPAGCGACLTCAPRIAAPDRSGPLRMQVEGCSRPPGSAAAGPRPAALGARVVSAWVEGCGAGAGVGPGSGPHPQLGRVQVSCRQQLGATPQVVHAQGRPKCTPLAAGSCPSSGCCACWLAGSRAGTELNLVVPRLCWLQRGRAPPHAAAGHGPEARHRAGAPTCTACVCSCGF